MRVLACYLVASFGAVAHALQCSDGFHCTNSYLHHEVRSYPLHREGHSRGEPKDLPKFNPDTNSLMSRVMDIKVKERAECEAREECPRHFAGAQNVKCVNGKADTKDEEFDCLNTDLLALVPIYDMDSTQSASDIWGWTDPETGDQIAIIGMEDRTAFVQVTAGEPIVLATLLQSGVRLVIWSDVKVYNNHAFIVRESNHGMQVVDLTKLRQYYNRAPGSSPVLLEESDYFYDIMEESENVGTRSTHNIVINEKTAFAYLVGTKTCRGGLHVVDISQFGDASIADPKAVFKGCFSEDGYTHDAQCVIYDGPDTNFYGKELCWAYNEDTITLVDVSDKTDMRMISRVTYEKASYTHQGWLTENQRYVIQNDELDEIETDEHRTRTLVWDYKDLTNPVLLGYRFSAVGINSVDHNLYIKGNKVHLSNYCSGYRVYELDDTFFTGLGNSANVTQESLLKSMPQVAYFDTAPYCDYSGPKPVFQGAWSSYPYFDNMVIVSNIETGLFVLDVKA